jgi:hypothetical protein
MSVATPFLPINMDGYGLMCHQMSDLTNPFCSNPSSIFFQEIWSGIRLPEITARVSRRRPESVLKNMDASYKAIGRSIIKQAWISIHRHPYFLRYTGLRTHTLNIHIFFNT